MVICSLYISHIWNAIAKPSGAPDLAGPGGGASEEHLQSSPRKSQVELRASEEDLWGDLEEDQPPGEHGAFQGKNQRQTPR